MKLVSNNTNLASRGVLTEATVGLNRRAIQSSLSLILAFHQEAENGSRAGGEEVPLTQREISE